MKIHRFGGAHPGEENGRAKLTLKDVEIIRASPERTGVLAKRFKVNPNTILRIRNGTGWAMVEEQRIVRDGNITIHRCI